MIALEKLKLSYYKRGNMALGNVDAGQPHGIAQQPLQIASSTFYRSPRLQRNIANEILKSEPADCKETQINFTARQLPNHPPLFFNHEMQETTPVSNAQTLLKKEDSPIELSSFNEKKTNVHLDLVNCSNEDELFDQFYMHKSKFSISLWSIFITKAAVFLKLEKENLNPPARLERLSEITKRNIVFLEEIASRDLDLHANSISNLVYIHSEVTHKSVKHRLDLKLSENFTTFLIDGLQKNYKVFRPKQLVSIFRHMSVLPRTHALQTLVNDFFLMQSHRADGNRLDLIESIAAFSNLRFNYGLQLWKKIDIETLNKKSVVKLIYGLQSILPFENTYYPDLDFSKLIDRVKTSKLNNRTFVNLFVAITACDYSDPDWDIRAEQMIQQDKVKVRLKLNLYEAMNQKKASHGFSF